MVKNSLRKVFGTLLQIIGAIFLLGIAVIPFFALQFAKLDLLGVYDYLLIGVSVIILFVVGSICFGLGKVIQLPSADKLMADDKRSCVLYLRSFEFDTVASENHVALLPLPDPTMAGVAAILRNKNYEETLSKVFSEIGPCIAVGKPGFEAQVPGFSRKPLSMETWQTEVQRLMQEAALVVICSGNTEGVLWELQEAKSIVPLERLLILITRDTSQAWWKRAQEIFDHKLPEFPRYPPYQEQAVHGLIYFDENKTARDELLVPFNKKTLREKISPVFARLHTKNSAQEVYQRI